MINNIAHMQNHLFNVMILILSTKNLYIFSSSQWMNDVACKIWLELRGALHVNSFIVDTWALVKQPLPFSLLRSNSFPTGLIWGISSTFSLLHGDTISPISKFSCLCKLTHKEFARKWKMLQTTSHF
jgi:hypothetical protein